MPNVNEEVTERKIGAFSMGDKSRAQIAKVLPCVAKMSASELATVGLNPAAVATVMAGQSGQPAMHGVSDGVDLTPVSVLAKKSVDLFYDILAPVDAFSTTFAQDYVLQGQPGILPKLAVPVYNDQDGAELDNYNSFAERTDTGTVTSAEITLHKIDKVICIYGRDIQQGVDLEKRLQAAVSAVARKVQKFILGELAVGKKDIAGTAVAGLTLPAIGEGDGKFNFAYANQTLSEAIQPRVHGMLLNSAHYGALKASNKDSLTAGDVDVDMVAKIQDADSLGSGAVGVIVNRRGVAVGLAAPHMLRGAYASYEQLTRGGQNIPLAVASWFEPNENCIKLWVGTMVGVSVVDAAAVKPLIGA